MIKLHDTEQNFVWQTNGSWFWGHDFDAGVHGPFASFEVAVEDWRREYSRKRGKKSEEI